MRTGTKVVVTVAAGMLLVAAGFGVFFVTRSLIAGDGQDASPPPERTTPTQTTTSPLSVEEGLPVVECGEIAATDAYGNPLGALEPLVRGIHDAACRRDYAGLLPYMESTFNAVPKEEVVAEWEREDSDGRILQTVAETLETPPIGDQGGQYFCHPGGAVAVFPRGTITQPGMWSEFTLPGLDLPAACGGVE